MILSEKFIFSLRCNIFLHHVLSVSILHRQYDATVCSVAVSQLQPPRLSSELSLCGVLDCYLLATYGRYE